MVKRYFPTVCQPDNFTVYARMREVESKEWAAEGGHYVLACDYDALSDAIDRERLATSNRVSFLEGVIEGLTFRELPEGQTDKANV